MRRLVIRPGAIGDLIVSLPALERLRTEYFEVWVAEQNVPLIRFANAVRSIGSTGLDLLEIEPPPPLVERLRSFDSIVSWYGANRPEFRDAAERLDLQFQFFAALPGGGKTHAVDYYLRQVDDLSQADYCVSQLGGAGPQACGRPPGRPSLRHEVCPVIETKPAGGPAAGLGARPTVIHPFASSRHKRWPLEKFREIARRLRMPVRWCAGPEEPLEDAVRIDNLYELACWLAQARLYIGNDSGISHLAAAVGVPTIVLFGPTDPAVWAPRGSRVLAPLEAIEPADVIAAVEAL
jgi:hypothetical protein